MQIIIWTIFLALSIACLAIGFMRQEKMVIIVGAIFMLISGLIVWGPGIDYKVGELEQTTIGVGNTSTLHTYQYEAFKGPASSYGLGTILLIFGVFLLLYVGVMGRNERKQRKRDRFERQEEQ